MASRQVGQGMMVAEDLDGQVLALRGSERVSGARGECGSGCEIGLWEGEWGRSLGVHTCSLRVWRGIASPYVNMEGTGI